MKVIVLGCGLVGSAIARDMTRFGFETTAVDLSAEAAQRLAPDQEKIHFQQANLADADTVTRLIAPFDLVIGAVPGFMGYQTLQTIITAGKNVVDISFFAEDPLTLNDLARQKNVTAIVDCGVAPGFSHIAFGFLSTYFDQPQSLTCYVGGLPVIREKPFEYKIVFSALDVIAEYTRPARFVRNGQLVVKEALSDVEELFFDSVGTLEAFNSDGLRTLIHTLTVPNMIEKTMRFPGHAEKMRLLRDVGLFESAPIEVGSQRVSPLEMTAKLLFPKLKLGPGQADQTVMRIIGEGIKDGKNIIYTFDLYDQYDPETNVTSMARTTGYTCSSVAKLLLEGLKVETGIICPEFLGMKPGFIEEVMRELKQRGVEIRAMSHS